jgi:hypothetical protein
VSLQGRGDGQAIHARKHSIQSYGVVCAGHGEPQTLRAIRHMIDLKPMPRQLKDDLSGGGFVILDRQNFGQAGTPGTLLGPEPKAGQQRSASISPI